MDLSAEDVIDYCANEDCGAEIHFGQPVFRIGSDLVCSSACLAKRLGAVKVTAGKEVRGDESNA